MFSDIRGFTSLSEGMTADELVRLLNEYLGEMTDVIFKNLGTLDKYIGDAIMAFWGSPYPQSEHALCACTCAIEMIRHLEKLNTKWQAEGGKEIAIGIGLNTGLVNVGNMGSPKRLAWTVMGDNVNLASRLEGMTKQYRSRHRHQRRNLQAGGGPFCLPRTRSHPGQGQTSAGRCLRANGFCSSATEISGTDHALRECDGGLSRAELAGRGGQIRRTSGIVSGRRTHADLPAARSGIHGDSAGSGLGWGVCDEEQVTERPERLLSNSAVCHPERSDCFA